VSETHRPHQSRSERKEQTRQALLDCMPALAAERGFAAVSLREVARSVGIVPTAFYRHFASLEELGLALVDDGIRSLRSALRDIRRTPRAREPRAVLAAAFDHVREHRALVGFLVRERHGGSAELRAAIATGLSVVARELAVDLSRFADQDTDELELVAELLVATMAERIAVFVESGPGDEAEILFRTEQLVRLILLGMAAWKPAPRGRISE
jgi:AcrR family transcriptional regulator